MQYHIDAERRECGVAAAGKGAVIGGAEALACLAIAVLEIGTALMIEIRCRSLVEIACHDRQPVVIVEVRFKDFPFVLVGDNGFAEFA